MNSVNSIKFVRGFFLKRSAIGAAVLFFLLAGAFQTARAQAISEGFDNIPQLPARGWFMQNNSVPVGTTGWNQGTTSVFTAQSGAADSYIRANFNNTTGTNTISNWLLTPNRTFRNGDVIKFWTREPTENPFPDRLEVRLSNASDSTNVGTGPNGVGDFTRLLLTINPNLEVGGYPQVWTEYTLTLSGLPNDCGSGTARGRIAFRYFVTGGGPTGDNSNYIGIDTFSFTPAIAATSAGGGSAAGGVPLDFNCDDKTDYVVVRNTGGAGGQMTWFMHDGTTDSEAPWGISTDTIIAGDFDGDDRADLAVYRRSASTFYALRSASGTLKTQQLGTTGDDPTVVGDYDGDDIDDFAVYRAGASAGQQSFWYYRRSVGVATTTVVQWGQNGDAPAPGDYDGDRKNDFCIRRNDGGQGVFYLNKSTGGTEALLWGSGTDLILPGDYDGDAKTDFAVARPANGQFLWSVLGRNGNNIIHFGEPWGLSAIDYTTQGDYDGDGKTDIAVWRPSSDSEQNFFYIRRSSNGALQAFEWGQQGDYPVANFNTH
ncbi:MAG TPA: choice-of-anchor J domain-containing protein [Pyrinomonadaceae bacterium]|jgi:hypothetical protein